MEGRWPGHLRDALFILGDGVFLGFIGGGSAVIADTVWGWELPDLLGMVIAMALAMMVQTLLAFLIAPLLGSIESMTPSMIVAMAVPMILDLLRMLGVDFDRRTVVSCGAGVGAITWLFLLIYARFYRRALGRAYGRA